MSLEIIGGQVASKIDYFEVIKAPPKDILEVDVIDDSAYNINNLYKKLFQFRYRYVYDDNEKSVWSAISKIPYPAKSTDSAYNALNNVQNAINIKIPTGDLNVVKIEIAGRVNIESLWSDFFLIDTIDKKIEKIDDNSFHFYLFKNESVYNPIDIQESNLLFDYVPDEANALELANGNTLVVGGLKDGYDRDLKLDIIIKNKINEQSPAVISNISATARDRFNSSPFVYADSFDVIGEYQGYQYLTLGIIEFTGTPQVGDVISISIGGFNRERWFNDFAQPRTTHREFNLSPTFFQTVVKPGWTLSDIVYSFVNSPNNGTGEAWNIVKQGANPSRPFFVPPGAPSNQLHVGANSTTQWWDRRTYIYRSISVSVRKSFSFGESDVFPIYKWNGLYKFGLVYYDKNGKTNGVLTDTSLTVNTGQYKTQNLWTPPGSPVAIPENETVELYINHAPPSWASYYHIVRTKELSCDFSLMVIACNTGKSDGFLYIDIHNINSNRLANPETSKVINYGTSSFVEGDRVRILQKYNVSSGVTIWDTKKPLDLPILSVFTGGDSRVYIKVKDFGTQLGPDVISINNGDALVIEIYRPAKILSNEDLVYYEIGYKYDIFIDENGNKYHGGQEIIASTDLLTVRIEDIPGDSVSSTATFRSDSNLLYISYNRAGSGSNYLIPLFDYILNNFKAGDYVRFENTQLNNKVFRIDSIYLDDSFLNIIFGSDEIAVNEVINHKTPNYFNIVKVTNPNTKSAYVSMFNDGDYYYKNRAMISNIAANSYGAIYVAEKNFSENYLSAVWSQGRPLIVDEDIKQEYYPSMLRFSQSYIYGTNINNLSRFYPNNFEEADASFGDILRLKTRENFIRMFQRYKVGMIPVYRQIIIDNAQSSQVALSERLLNKPNYYSGEYGIDKYGSSLVSTDYGDYFIDTNNKAIVRVSLDGITNVSDTNNLSSWANENIKEDSFGYGCFNYENRNVIMLIGHKQSIPQFPNLFLLVKNIVAYSESDKNFESFYGFTDAENIQFVNGLILTGYQGKWYIHDNNVRNNFFGQQQNSSITTVFNGGLQMKKTYTAIEELANGLWTGTITTGPLTNQLTSLTSADFQKTVGAYVINSKENKFNATIKRDQNSAGGKFQGDTMKGLYAQVALTNSLTTQQRLISVSLKYITSPLTNS